MTWKEVTKKADIDRAIEEGRRLRFGYYGDKMVLVPMHGGYSLNGWDVTTEEAKELMNRKRSKREVWYE